jgi:type III pantothenate kinase
MAIFVTVVGGSSSYLTEFCNSILKSDQFLEVGYKNVPITTLVPHPGPDRVVTAIAAARKFGTESGPMLVLDFGTATTFDLVEVANNKLIISSGIIAIGPITMKNGFTRAIPGLKNKYNFNKDVRVLEMDVISQVSSGAYHGYLGMICGLIDGSLSELLAKNRLHTSEKLNLVITGGPSQIFENGLKVRYRNHDHVTFVSRENDLMMEGLFCIYEFNKALRHLQSQQMKNVANQNSVQTEGLQSKL